MPITKQEFETMDNVFEKGYITHKVYMFLLNNKQLAYLEKEIREQLNMKTPVYHSLKKLLEKKMISKKGPYYNYDVE